MSDDYAKEYIESLEWACIALAVLCLVAVVVMSMSLSSESDAYLRGYQDAAGLTEKGVGDE